MVACEPEGTLKGYFSYLSRFPMWFLYWNCGKNKTYLGQQLQLRRKISSFCLKTDKKRSVHKS